MLISTGCGSSLTETQGSLKEISHILNHSSVNAGLIKTIEKKWKRTIVLLLPKWSNSPQNIEDDCHYSKEGFMLDRLQQLRINGSLFPLKERISTSIFASESV